MKWFRVIWYIVSCKSAVDATEFQKAVNIGSNRTALSVLNKIRDAMGMIEMKNSTMLYMWTIFLYLRGQKKNLKMFTL